MDYIRKRIWNDSRIKWWYRQNIVFYVKKGNLNNYPALKKEYESNGPSPLALVHPELFIMAQEQLRSPSLGRVLRLLPRLVINEILQRVGRLF